MCILKSISHPISKCYPSQTYIISAQPIRVHLYACSNQSVRPDLGLTTFSKLHIRLSSDIYHFMNWQKHCCIRILILSSHFSSLNDYSFPVTKTKMRHLAHCGFVGLRHMYTAAFKCGVCNITRSISMWSSQSEFCFWGNLWAIYLLHVWTSTCMFIETMFVKVCRTCGIFGLKIASKVSSSIN